MPKETGTKHAQIRAPAAPTAERQSGQIRRIGIADTSSAKVAAAILAVSIPSNPLCSIPDTRFLNTGEGNINNGETMVAPVEAPRQGVRLTLSEIQASPDQNIRNLEGEDNQRALRNRTNQLAEALEGTGSVRGTLLGALSAEDARSARERYAALDDTEKKVFLNRMASVFAEQFMHGNTTVPELGGAVQGNMDSTLGFAESFTENASLLAGIIPSIRRFFFGRLEEAAPVETVAVGEAVAYDITDDSIAAAFSEYPDELNPLLEHEFTDDELMALSWLQISQLFFSETPATQLASKLPQLVENTRTSARAISGQADLSDSEVDARIQAGLATLATAFGTAIAGVFARDATNVQALGRNIYSYFYQQKYYELRDGYCRTQRLNPQNTRFLGEEGVTAETATSISQTETTAERAAARADWIAQAQREATQKVQDFMQAIRAGGTVDVRAALTRLGVTDAELIRDPAFYGATASDNIDAVTKRMNRLLSKGRLTNTRFARLVFRGDERLGYLSAADHSLGFVASSAEAFTCTSVQSGFVSAMKHIFADPWSEINKGLSGSKVADVFAIAGRFLSFFPRILPRSFTEFGRGGFGRNLGAGTGAVVGFGVWVGALGVTWGLAEWLSHVTGITDSEWGPIDAWREIVGSSSTTPTRSEAARPQAQQATLTDAQRAAAADARSIIESYAAIQSRQFSLTPILNTYLHGAATIGLPRSSEISENAIVQASVNMPDDRRVVKDFLASVADYVSTHTMTPEQAQAYFYQRYFERHSTEAVGLISSLVPESGRLGVYKEFFTSVMRTWPGDENMVNTLLALPAFSSVAITTINTKFPTMASALKSLVTSPSEQAEWYGNLMVYAASPGNERLTDKQMLDYFLKSLIPNIDLLNTGLFSRTEIRSLRDAAVIEWARIAVESGQDLSTIDMNAFYPILARHMSSEYPALRDILDNITALPAEGGFKMLSYRLLTDLAAGIRTGAVDPNDLASAERFFKEQFNAVYPGQTVLDSFTDEGKLTIVLRYLPHLEGAERRTLTTAEMERRVLSDESLLPLMAPAVTLEELQQRHAAGTLDAATFISMPEDVQRAYWNWLPEGDSRGAQASRRVLWTGATDAWREDHSFLKPTGRGRRAKYPDWPEETAAE